MSLDRALTSWRKERTDANALAVERAGDEAARHHPPNDWDVSTFDAHRLKWVLEWLPGAPPAPRLAALKHLGTTLPDPRATAVLLRLLRLSLLPIERALVLAGLELNADPREARFATEAGAEAEAALLALRREKDKWLRFAREREAMLGAMFAAPDDVQLRLVTADWLNDFGDPLGELMALQLSGAPGAEPRQRELLARYEAVWCADLFAPEPVRELRFEAGVPARIKVPRPLRWVPACATVCAVESVSADVGWLEKPRWKRVRLLRPLPTFESARVEQHRSALTRFDEFHVFDSHRGEGHSKLLGHADGRLEFFTTREPVPGWWKNVAALWPGRPLKLWVPTTSAFEPPAGVEVEFLPSAELHERMYRAARELERQSLLA